MSWLKKKCQHPIDDWIKVSVAKEEPHSEDFVYRVTVFQCGICKKHLIDEGLACKYGVEAFLRSDVPPHVRAYIDKETQ